MDKKRRYRKSKRMFILSSLCFLFGCTNVPFEDQPTFIVNDDEEAKEVREKRKNKKGVYHIIQHTKTHDSEENAGTTIINW